MSIRPTYFRSNIHQNGPEILGVKNWNRGILNYGGVRKIEKVGTILTKEGWKAGLSCWASRSDRTS
jgi:hypothetical protein